MGALYVGSTNNLRARVEDHRRGEASAHTAKYKINCLVWFERHDTYSDALQREKRIKRWRREWKLQLVFEMNPQWRDISGTVPE